MALAAHKTAVLIIGFGGPNGMSEVRPFLDSVLKGVRIPQARYDEVLHHYELFHGVSPYNSVTRRQSQALAKLLSEQGHVLPVYVGYRHSAPHFVDTFKELKHHGIHKVIGFVLAPHRSSASFEKYINWTEQGRQEADAADIQITYTENFYRHPLFIQAQTERILEVTKKFSKKDMETTYFLFSAHSIPTDMAEASGYAEQYAESAKLVSEQLGLKTWGLAYQSRSGNPRDPWLTPDTKDFIDAMDRTNIKNIVLIPVGFLCDNIEVLFDLDAETKQHAESKGLRYYRASTVEDHPAFIRMMADVIEKILT